MRNDDRPRDASASRGRVVIPSEVEGSALARDDGPYFPPSVIRLRFPRPVSKSRPISLSMFMNRPITFIM